MSGTKGYNNGIKILNDVCSDLYSYSVNKKDGTIKQLVNARCFRFSDINKVLRTPLTYKTITTSYKEEFINFPNIFLKEKGTSFSKEQSFFEFTNELGPEEQYSWVEGTHQTIQGDYNLTMTGLNHESDYYYSSIDENRWRAPEYLSMIKGGGSSTNFYLGTRDAVLDGGYPLWGFLQMNIDELQIVPFADYSGGAPQMAMNIRVVLEVDLSNVILGESGDGLATTPWSMRFDY